MTRSRAITLLIGAAMMPLALAACGNSGSTAAKHGSAKPRRPTVDTAKSRYGEILVDSKGRTLYLFAQDEGSRTTCFSSCARAWPPLRTKDRPTAGGHAQAAMVGRAKRPDGPDQVTYNGHPLYLYQGDLKPGDATGQGVDVWGDVWWVMSPAGKQNTKGGRKPPGAGY